MQVNRSTTVITGKSTDVIKQAIALGDAHRGYYRMMPHVGYLTGPVYKNGWKFVPLEQDDTILPKEAQKQLNLLVQHGFPIKQIIIGHEPKPEQKKVDIPKLPKIKTEPIVKVIKVLGQIAIGGALVVGYAIITALTMVDPILLVTFEGEERWLLCIATWDE